MAYANPLKGQSTVPLSDGRVLTLTFDFDALSAAEEASGLKVPEIFAELALESPSLRVQRALIYGALVGNHPEITLKQAGQLLLDEAEAFEAAFARAMAGSIGPVEGGGAEADDDPRSRGAGIGASSSPGGAVPA